MFPSIVFFGTPNFGAHLLDYLLESKVPVVGIVTQPDRPKGRSLQLTASPVKEIWKEKLSNVALWQPEKCSNPDFLIDIANVKADLYVVVAFGQILPKKLLDIPQLGCINVHASLLPKYRGAAPIQHSLLNGEEESGIAIQKMVKELDAGDVIEAKKIKIPPEMTYGELEKALCELAKPMLLDVLKRYGRAVPDAIAQDVSQVTYAPKPKPEEAEIDWSKPATVLHNMIRAFNPRPGAWTWILLNGERKRLKIWRSKVSSFQGISGELLSSQQVIVGCGADSLILEEVQLEGKPRMAAADWLRGIKKLQFNTRK
jgi:methionyl-tRNA formyltransferase